MAFKHFEQLLVLQRGSVGGRAATCGGPGAWHWGALHARKEPGVARAAGGMQLEGVRGEGRSARLQVAVAHVHRQRLRAVDRRPAPPEAPERPSMGFKVPKKEGEG